MGEFKFVKLNKKKKSSFKVWSLFEKGFVSSTNCKLKQKPCTGDSTETQLLHLSCCIIILFLDHFMSFPAVLRTSTMSKPNFYLLCQFGGILSIWSLLFGLRKWVFKPRPQAWIVISFEIIDLGWLNNHHACRWNHRVELGELKWM